MAVGFHNFVSVIAEVVKPALEIATMNIVAIRIQYACYLVLAISCPMVLLDQGRLQASEPIDIGDRLELFVDDFLLAQMDGTQRRLHEPTPRNIAVACDQPWEGNGVGYVTVIPDDDVYRMYFRGVNTKWAPGEIVNTRQVVCYAESSDGIHWTKPKLGLFEHEGSKENNIVWIGKGVHNFAPFKDANPDCKPDEKFKAVGGGPLYGFTSPDGIHWSQVSEEPIITHGAFDSQNLVFWDSNQGEYRDYHRGFRDGRDILTASSKDFRDWTQPVFLEYVPSRMYQLYTNQITLYHRAPHIYLGFPTRYYDRGWTPSTDELPQVEHRKLRAETSPREGSALTDGLFMSSRDGKTFEIWPEAFVRPGPQRPGTWFYCDHYQNWGLVETESDQPGAPPELSIYLTENTAHTTDVGYIRRYSLRLDGFVSISARASGGECVTKPIRFQGNRLLMNFSTSVAGGIRIEIQAADGKPIPGYSLDDAVEAFGDQLDRVAMWKHGSDVSQLQGKTVRLRFEMKDADLYSIQFRE